MVLLEMLAFTKISFIILSFMSRRIEPNEKTQIPLKLTKNPVILSEKGIWVQLTPRLKLTKENCQRNCYRKNN
uniref:Uncharacterized protein n=1 Tax=Phlebotomus papatasi TaxID=29031 RepID=A0A1B0D3B6_PHLPP